MNYEIAGYMTNNGMNNSEMQKLKGKLDAMSNVKSAWFNRLRDNFYIICFHPNDKTLPTSSAIITEIENFDTNNLLVVEVV